MKLKEWNVNCKIVQDWNANRNGKVEQYKSQHNHYDHIPSATLKMPSSWIIIIEIIFLEDSECVLLNWKIGAGVVCEFYWVKLIEMSSLDCCKEGRLQP